MRRGLRIRAKITFNWTFGPHTHTGEDYGFRAKTKFSAYHNHFSDYSKKCQCSHAPGV